MATIDDKLTARRVAAAAQGGGPGPDPRPPAPRHIAYRDQETLHGGLPPATLREIERLARQLARPGEAAPVSRGRIKLGTRLVRDWGGASHRVVVLEHGFLYREERYTSLSAIAGTITGAKWSGPRFFGTVRAGGSNG